MSRLAYAVAQHRSTLPAVVHQIHGDRICGRVGPVRPDRAARSIAAASVGSAGSTGKRESDDVLRLRHSPPRSPRIGRVAAGGDPPSSLGSERPATSADGYTRANTVCSLTSQFRRETANR